MNARNMRFLKLAKKMSAQSESKFRVGAVIAKGSRILGAGSNDMHKTHPKSMSSTKCIHAEHAALINSGPSDLIDAVAYVSRITRDGATAIAKPCSSCRKLLFNAGIRKVFYSVSDFPFWEVDEF